MGTLPTADNLPRRLPQPEQRVQSIPDGSAITAGAQRLGAGVQTFGNSMLLNEQEDRKKDLQLHTAAATLELSKGLLSAGDIPSTDNNFATYRPRYEQVTKETLDRAAAMIPDPQLRQTFIAKGQLQIEAGNNAIGDVVRAKEKDTRLAVLNQSIDEAAKLAVDKRQTPEGHTDIIGTMRSTIKAMVDRGDLTAVEGQKREADFASAYAFNRRAAAYKEDLQGTSIGRLGYTPPADTGSLDPAARGVLLPRLAGDKDPAQHIDKMKPRFASGLASMFEAAPPEIKAGLGILSGTRSRERQQQLWDASDKSGRTVGRPDGSRHVHGDAADLSFNGKKLDDKSVPQAVRDWVAQNAPKHGLGLPMSYEPWHVEDWEARPPDSAYGAKVRRAVASARPDLMASSSVNRAREFPALSPQEFFGPGTDVASLPAGLRNNNPGNIKYVRGSSLPGIIGPSKNTDQGDPQAVFSSPQAGATAAAQLLLRKFDGGKATVRQIIAAQGGWTPGNSNAVASISKYAQLGPDQKLDLRGDPKQLTQLMRGIFMQEQGDQHAKYGDDILSQAASSAIGGEPLKFASGGGTTQLAEINVTGSGGKPQPPAQISFDTDVFLTPQQRFQLDAMADAQTREYRAAMRSTISDAVENAPAAIENGGQYTGEVPTRDDFVNAYGEDEGAKRAAAFDTQMETAATARDFQTASNSQIQETLSSASPQGSTGATAALDQKRFQVLQSAADRVLKARAADPAAYVIQTMPSVAAAWDVAQPGQPSFANALRLTDDAQATLGIPTGSRRLLPVTTAKGIVDTFKDETTPGTKKIEALTSTVFSTKNPDQQRAIFNQLVDAGIPASTEGALEASARGDAMAADRLMTAALIDPDKIPGAASIKTDDVRKSIQSEIMDKGQIGDVIYGLGVGTADNYERALRDRELIERAVKLRVGKGEEVTKATQAVARDLFGDKEVYKSDYGVNVALAVDKGTDTDVLHRGLEVLTPRVKEVLSTRNQALLEKQRATASAANGQRAIISNALPRQVERTMADGVWRATGDGIGFFDVYSGGFIAGADGKPLIFSQEEALAAGRSARPRPRQWFEPSIDGIPMGAPG